MLSVLTKLVFDLKIKKGGKVSKRLDEMIENSAECNEKTLLQLLDENKDTEFGKKYDFANIKTVEEYQRKVPFTTYDDYYPYIERMLKGEKNLITSKEICHYAATSGSVDNPKKIPVVKDEGTEKVPSK